MSTIALPWVVVGMPPTLGASWSVETSLGMMIAHVVAAGAVVSTVDDMHVFIEALLAGDLFASETSLTEMQEAVATGSMTILNYGIGLAENSIGADKPNSAFLTCQPSSLKKRALWNRKIINMPNTRNQSMS